MRVLIADSFSAQGKASFASLGLEVDDRPELDAESLPDALHDSGAAVLIVRSTLVTADALAKGSQLALVIRAGAGVNNIDLEAASRLGIFVTNCPGKNAVAVAELAMGLVIALDRNLPDAVAELRQGHWLKKHFGRSRGLKGRTLGLVGFGAIAREVAQRALGFEMVVRAYDLVLTDELARAHRVQRAASVAELVADCDYVSVHVPYIKGSTHHLIGAAELAAMKDGAALVHTSRGGVVDDVALAAAVRSGRLRAAVDVFEGEPDKGKAQWKSELVAAGAYGTPHIGASTDQAGDAIADEALRIVTDYLGQGVVHNCVNLQAARVTACTLVVRHHDPRGVPAAVLEALAAEQLAIEGIHNLVFKGNEAASTTIALSGAPTPELVARLGSRDEIVAVSVRSR